MWIEPNGTVKILQNVRIDNRYNNTLYFVTRADQYNYFNSKVKYTYNKITYQRAKRNYIRVEINAENLYDCNYLMFQNTSFGNRWFYAFITKVEYVANSVSSIEYEIDVMQTWFYDCIMRECFVDREHSTHDYLYSNLIEEGLELGEYLNSPYRFANDHTGGESGGSAIFQEDVLVIATPYIEIDGQFVRQGLSKSGNIVSAINYKIFDTDNNGLVACEQWLDRLTRDQKSDAIVTAYLMPRFFARELTNVSNNPVVTQDYYDGFGLKVGNYTPRNRKLLTHPYRFLNITDFHGQDIQYRYEFFNNRSGMFEVRFVMGMSPEPSVLIYPLNYKGNANNINEFFVVKCFPLVGYSIDGFKAWLAQNWGTIVTQQASTLASLATFGIGSQVETNTKSYSSSSGSTTRVGGILSPLVSAFGQMAQIAQHTAMPSFSKNNPTADAQWQSAFKWFGYCDMYITEEYARKIDDFFDVFGYKTNELKIPNINSRPHWNYIKTADANITGNIPADDLQDIINIFNRGITFWKNGDEVGDYSLDNRPL